VTSAPLDSSPGASKTSVVLLASFALVFLNAFLLFLIQPMFAKMILPLLGGSPAVWTTCVLCFQALLLAGYMYAHLSARRLRIGRQAALQAIVVLLAAAFLFVGPPEGPGSGVTSPIGWIVRTMLWSIGAPFFALSATSPLVQRWFSVMGHRASRDPYFLYAASNTGSLAALLLYPVAVEPLLPLRAQRALWAWGYLGTALLVTSCAVAVARRRSDSLVMEEPEERLRADRRLRWLLLAFVPSGLMLAVTSHISTDVAAVPLLWVVPLALYLVTFILAFGWNAGPAIRLGRRALPLLLLPLVLFLIVQGSAALWFIIPLNIGTFFVLALLCHAELARDRPPSPQLTAFYLWVTAGGMLGGVFNSLIGPALFVRIAEYPILLALGCVVLARASTFELLLRRPRMLLRPVAAAGLAAASLAAAAAMDVDVRIVMPLLGISALICFSVSREPPRFAVAVALLLAVGVPFGGRAWGDVLYAERTFFGVYRIAKSRDGRFVSLFHGTTLHGTQSVTTTGAGPEPLAYYHRAGPIGDVFATRPQGVASVGIVGLGVGSLAAYVRPGEQWTFYEIDSAVERIARDDRYFTFLRACGEACRVVLGDGRLSLRATSPSHDILVLDAFTSDAIPVHLLTKEAVASYLADLADGGLLAFHISNRHFDLEPVLAAAAADLNLFAAVRSDSVDDQRASGRSASRWLAMARNEAAMRPLTALGTWRRASAGGVRAWTDDFSDVWSVLHWR
jgi:spermidine synthase